MLCVLVCTSNGGTYVYGQGSFLEKLEAAVRNRLAESRQANQPSNNSAATQKVPVEQAPAEELPSPPANGNPPSNRPAGVVSILEDGSKPPLPADRPVPPPAADSGRTSNASTAAGRIYLGLEAEEITGGGIGVRVTKVSEGSPAWKAGFRTGDRIAGINGFATANLDAMVERLGKTTPGETVKFLVNRNDRNMELVAVLMDADLASRIAGGPLATGAQTDLNSLPVDSLPRNRMAANTASPDELSADALASSAPWLGVVVNDLTPAFRKQFGLTVFRGAAITSVTANSPASKIGLVAGDAIIAVAVTPIETARDLTVWMSSARPGQEVEITYQRGTIAHTSPLTLEVTPESRTAKRTPGLAAPAIPPTPTAERRATLGDSAEQMASEVVPNAAPTLVAPDTGGTAASESTTAEVAELRREVARLRAELEKANQRLESTQNRLQKIIEGLGKD